MITKFKNWVHKLYPSELEHAIETVIFKFENNKEEDRELVRQMLEQLNERLEFERFLSYNNPDDSYEGYKIKLKMENDKYDEELQQLINTIHANNGTYDRVMKRVREYHEYVHNKSRIAETLHKLKSYHHETENETENADAYVS